MSDPLDRLKFRLAQNALGYYDRLIREQQLCDRLPRPLVYRGYDANSGRAIVQPLGGQPVTGQSVTNGAIRIGNPVAGRSQGGTLKIDSMPRVRRRAIAPVIFAQVFDDLVYLYRIDSTYYLFDRNGRVVIPNVGVEDLFFNNAQVNFLSDRTKIASILSSGGETILVKNNFQAPTSVSGSEVFNIRPRGYNVWGLSVVVPDLEITGTTVGGQTVSTRNPEYLICSGSSTYTPLNIEGNTSANTQTSTSSYEIGSVWIDAGTGQVLVQKGLFQRSAEYSDIAGGNIQDSGSQTISMSGSSIILPGVTKPYSMFHSKGLIAYQGDSECWESLLIDESKTKAIAFKHVRSIRTEQAVRDPVTFEALVTLNDRKTTAWVVEVGQPDAQCNSNSILVCRSTSPVPIAVGSVTITGSISQPLWDYRKLWNGSAPVGQGSVVGQSVVVCSKDAQGVITKGVGAIASVQFTETSQLYRYTSVTINVTAVYTNTYDSMLGNSNTVVYSDNGSVYAMIEHFAPRSQLFTDATLYGEPFNYGIDLADRWLGGGPSDMRGPIVNLVATTAINLGYSWAGNRFYLLQNTNLPTADESIVNAERWDVVVEAGVYHFRKNPVPIALSTNAIYQPGEFPQSLTGAVFIEP